MSVEQASKAAKQIAGNLNKVLIGQENAVEEVTISLITGGHTLLEGVPGTGKTLLARALAYITGTQFKRIQFTPDLMPSDIIGVNVFNANLKEFKFQPGPIFCDVLLADEINRAPAKTQSALLEAMQELQATVDGKSYPMSKVFTVLATQNPVEFEGTYPLPEAQVDRFMMKVVVDYPVETAEQSILDKVEQGFDSANLVTAGISKILDSEKLVVLRKITSTVRIEEIVRRYITQIIRRTRSTVHISLGASPRAAVMLMAAAKGKALISGRDFVTPDDVKAIALPVLRHRVLLLPEAEVEGRTADDCIKMILKQIDIPR